MRLEEHYIAAGSQPESRAHPSTRARPLLVAPSQIRWQSEQVMPVAWMRAEPRDRGAIRGCDQTRPSAPVSVTNHAGHRKPRVPIAESSSTGPPQLQIQEANDTVQSILVKHESRIRVRAEEVLLPPLDRCVTSLPRYGGAWL